MPWGCSDNSAAQLLLNAWRVVFRYPRPRLRRNQKNASGRESINARVDIRDQAAAIEALPPIPTQVSGADGNVRMATGGAA